MRACLMAMVCIVLTSGPAWGQATHPAGAPASATQPATAEPGQPEDAIIDEVEGSVRYAVTREDGALGEWKPAQVGDRLPPGTRIQTFPRSHVMIKFTDDTVIMIESLTSASIDDFRRSADSKSVKLGIAHGAIRGASAEMTLRSDLTISSPTATLSKRGTIGFRMEYEPVVGHFVISLETEGLIEALNELTNQSRLVRPLEYVTEAMKRWIVTAVFDDYIPVIDFFGMTEADHHFGAFYANGIAVVEPSGGWNTRSLVGINPSALYRDQAYARRAGRLRPVFFLIGRPDRSAVNFPEGNFGTGPGR